MTTPSSVPDDLDTLLDDALDDFAAPQPRTTPPIVPAAPLVPPVPSPAQPSSAAPSPAATPKAAPAGLGGSGLGGKTKQALAAPPKGLDSGSGLPKTATQPTEPPPPGLGLGLGGGLPPKKNPQTAGKSSAGGPPPDIDRVADGLATLMEQLVASESQATSSSTGLQPPPAGDDVDATLEALRALGGQGGTGGAKDSDPGLPPDMASVMAGLGLGGAGSSSTGDGGGGGMEDLLGGIMKHLLSKDVLYQPMKDIGERYPAWLEKHSAGLPSEEVARYHKQQDYIKEICTLYEQEPENFDRLLELMTAMQTCGQPPQEIIDELAPGMDSGGGLPNIFGGAGAGGGAAGGMPPGMPPGGCPIQ